ncbi:uncharacterized protein SCODWIG_00674 [Saccharomycodes ludwigii]|uniref:Rrn9 domain-containing protein n=1 Tax=Saccharomycodes ludwigii TaxID=36035 RepID=A0A376B2L1_9ASCO|nr:uncharacterized protein SCODWIG_00674 [Saccharomycodes ludwigii]
MNEVRQYNDILKYLEIQHRQDLATHLYSTFLLKKLLKLANGTDYKHTVLIDRFINCNIKHAWTLWPNENTDINPKTNEVYCDNSISPNINNNRMQMLLIELSSVWSKQLCEKHNRNIDLDLDSLDIPLPIVNKILNRLDCLFKRLVIQQLKVSVDFEENEQKTGYTYNISSEDHPRTDREDKNSHRVFNHMDILTNSMCNTKQQISLIDKVRTLFEVLPNTLFDKSQFKIDDASLQPFENMGKPLDEDPGYIASKKTVKKLRVSKMNITERAKYQNAINKDKIIKDLLAINKTAIRKNSKENKNNKNLYSLDDCLIEK